MNLWGITDIGSVREQNQDDYYIEQVEPDLGLAIVCDGMGGARAGNIASQLAVQTFLETAKSSPPQEWRAEPEALLHSAAQQANTAVYTMAGREPECRGMGTTMVAALVVGQNAYILNIGDSRCYLVQPDGIRRLTRDHSVVEDLVTRGKITPEQARQHPQKNLITRALGAEAQLRADLYRQALSPGDALLLCSDGLSNVVTEQEVLYEVLHGGPAEDCCRRLLDIALLRGAPDNVTAVLLQM
ncbi:MAG TPA: Stp1/IreP family PP2C-type Ser/Thr phosphatase [Candidatus Intestinimonas pullistercoris]|uniref:Stp1/IreP family PP2C-type Ser/Thr phosphatase n=1 Tax=Candidatus Intestinimonas pullistercoris TaxID=2838623 RepID=A0A9D2NYB5_9FIRM|nr:Stp1/IreP family PP2C-type Ser/Thr phosphatase [uncultured Intestinimonas sp.]HJC40192.1 Stp1/IreP family PP2C-type Ser/Thr phosphatase [Candidatus Intestinimonas pullistercoris]